MNEFVQKKLRIHREILRRWNSRLRFKFDFGLSNRLLYFHTEKMEQGIQIVLIINTRFY